MKFTVIGHCSVDVHHDPDGSEKRNLGGICLAVGALATIASETDVITPVFGVGGEEADEVRAFLARFSNVDAEGLFALAGKTNEVHLFPDGNGRGIECSKQIAPPIPFANIEPYLGVNGIFIDMVSGSDILLDTLDQIRLAVRPKGTPIHIDLHSLTLGVGTDAARYRRPLAEWRRWCFMVHSVQMNEEEAAGLTVEQYSEEGLARQMLPLMVNAFCLTRGVRGVTVFQQQHKHLLREEIEGVPAGVANAIGCGDVFGAAFLYAFTRSKDSVKAAQFANEVAAAQSLSASPREFGHLSRFRISEGTAK